MSSSDWVLSTTTTISGLLDEARTRTHEPSSRWTRTPLTVITSVILRPRIEPPAANRSWYSFTTSATTPYFTSSPQCGLMVSEVKATGRALRMSDSFTPGLRSSMARMAAAAVRPQS
jgi:hypothetical protein